MSVKGLPPYSAHYLTLNETISFLREKKDKAEVYSFSEQTLKEDVPVRLPLVPDMPQDMLPKQTIRWLLKQGFTPSFVKNEVVFTPPSLNYSLLNQLIHEEKISAFACTSSQMLVTGSVKGSVKLWDLSKKEPIGIEIERHSPFGILTTYEHLLAIGSTDGTIKIWNIASSALYCTLKGDAVPVSAVIFLNKYWLITGFKDGKIKLWDLKNIKCTDTKNQDGGSVNTLLACQNGKMLISGSSNGPISIWGIDLELGVGRIMTKHTLKKEQEGHSGSVNALALLPNGTIVSASSDKTLKIWNSSASTLLGTYQMSFEVVDLCLVTSNMLGIKSKNNEIKICNTQDLDPTGDLAQMRIRVVGALNDPSKHVSHLTDRDDQINFAFMANGNIGSWSPENKKILVWKFSTSCIKTGEKEELLAVCAQSTKELEAGLPLTESEERQGVSSYLFSLVSRSEPLLSTKEAVGKSVELLKEFERHLRANNTKDAKKSIRQALNLTSPTPVILKVRRVYIAFILFQGKTAQASFLYPDLKLLLKEKVKKGEQVAKLSQEKDAAVTKADEFSLENEKMRKEHQQALTQKQQEIQKLQTGYEKKIGLLTTISQLKLAKTISNLPEAIHKLVAFEDNLVGETTTGKALIWNMGTWERKPPKEGSSNDIFLNSFLQLTKNDSHPLTLEIPPFTTFTIHHSESLLAFYSQKPTIQIVSVAEGKVVRESPKFSSAAKAMSFREQYLAASFSGGIITVWDFKNFTVISSLKDLGDIKGIALLPNGLLAYAVGDTIFLRSLDDKSQIHRKLTGHSGSIRALLPFADEYLISGSEDRTIKFWDTTRNICIRTLESPKKILSLGLLPDQALISSNEDATIDIWK